MAAGADWPVDDKLRRVIVEPDELIDPIKLVGGPFPARTAITKIQNVSNPMSIRPKASERTLDE